MAIMSGALYDALKSAHVSDELSRKAAEEVADIRTEFASLRGRMDTLDAKIDGVKWMVGVNITLTLVVLGFAVRAVAH